MKLSKSQKPSEELLLRGLYQSPAIEIIQMEIEGCIMAGSIERIEDGGSESFD